MHAHRWLAAAGLSALALGAALLFLQSRLGAAPADPATSAEPELATAIFAGGCFWCMEPPFDELEGVHATISGYIGGRTVDPSYGEVSAGTTGHAEAVKVTYDPAKIRYEALLDVFWKNIDPLVENRQFCDVGSQYRSAIFYLDAEQKRLAEASRDALARSGVLPGPIRTEIEPAGPFYAAEEYHQDYYEKNALRYKAYRWGCGRDQRLKEIWGE